MKRFGAMGQEFGSRYRQQNEGRQERGRETGRQAGGGVDPMGYYRELEVSPRATEEEIKGAYRRLALETHPDRQRQNGTEARKRAEERFKRVGEAYNVLRKREGRAKYDAGL